MRNGLIVSAWIAGIFIVSGLASYLLQGSLESSWLSTFLLAILLLLFAWMVYSAWRRGVLRADWLYALDWQRSTMGALIVVCSIAYFFSSLLALPLRKEADARLDQFIARGEVALLRDASTPPRESVR